MPRSPAIGCHSHPITDWLKNYQTIGINENYTPDQIAEYGLILNFAAEWLKLKFGEQQ
jgi:hypothetical protein